MTRISLATFMGKLLLFTTTCQFKCKRGRWHTYVMRVNHLSPLIPPIRFCWKCKSFSNVIKLNTFTYVHIKIWYSDIFLNSFQYFFFGCKQTLNLHRKSEIESQVDGGQNTKLLKPGFQGTSPTWQTWYQIITKI